VPTYKISQLTTATAVSATNQFEINQNGTSKSVEVSVIDVYIKSISNLPVVVSVSSASDALRITQTGTGNALLVEDSANPDATPFVIDASGNVGIGTSSPGLPLDVYNATSSLIRAQGDSTVQIVAARNSTDTTAASLVLRKFRGTVASPSAAASGDTTGSLTFQGFGGTNNRATAQIISFLDTYVSDTNISGSLVFNTNAGSTGTTERMRINSSGNVGIGTSSPASKLSVSNATSVQVQATTGTVDFRIQSIDVASAAYSGTVSNHAYVFTTNNSERMRISSGGEFLVDTTTNDTSSRISTRATTGVINGVGVYCTTTAATNAMVFFNPNGQVGTIQVTGSATAYITSSDYRLKHDVQPMATGLATIKLLKPVTYKWNADNDAGEGFIAHELAEHIPLAVTGEKDAINKDGSIKSQGVDYSKIVVHLVAAIQELSAKVAVLEGKQ